jgi:dephospho-CoA kinase
MKVIGLLGGIASGKSMVAEQLAACGAKVLNADQIAHEVLRRADVEAAARSRWGGGVFGPDGHIDRARLAEVVFAPPPEGPRHRAYLEQLTHAEVIRIIEEELAALRGSAVGAAVIDAPLLAEVGLDKICDMLVFVDAPERVRLERAAARGWRKEDFAAREDAQESLDSKRKLADLIIDNSGPPEQTQAQVRRLWSGLIRRSP